MSEQNNSETKPVHIPTVAIVGRPNVGKSSLFNAIVGRRLSIVHEMPGVTRDRVVAPLVRGKCRFQLIDTGGLGMLSGETRKVDMWDSRIASQVDIAIGGADVLILVANVQDGVVNLDEEVAARLREPIRGEAGDSGDASATPAADRSSGRITHVSARQRMLFGEVAAVRGNQQQRREARLLRFTIWRQVTDAAVL